MKNLKNLGKALNKVEQKEINGGAGEVGYWVQCKHDDGLDWSITTTSWSTASYYMHVCTQQQGGTVHVDRVGIQ